MGIDATKKNMLGNGFIPFIWVAAAVVLLVMVNGCAPRRVPPYEQPQDVKEQSITKPYSDGPAHGLFEEANRFLAQGNNQRAEIAMERALRIEPSNPYYWYTMGRIAFKQGRYSQAVQFCLKSKSMAGRSVKLLDLNDHLIGQALQEGKEE